MMENVTAGFSPKPWARSAHLQTIFASLKYRLKGRNEMADCAQETILEGFDGSRLLGYLSRCEAGKAKGLVLLIHGWEGSSDSTYILSTGRYLFKNGYDDSGQSPGPWPSHHLTRGFSRALIEETHNAVINAAACPTANRFRGRLLIGRELRVQVARGTRCLQCQPQHVFGISSALDRTKHYFH